MELKHLSPKKIDVTELKKKKKKKKRKSTNEN